jgi:hypothetical protein
MEWNLEYSMWNGPLIGTIWYDDGQTIRELAIGGKKFKIEIEHSILAGRNSK